MSKDKNAQFQRNRVIVSAILKWKIPYIKFIKWKKYFTNMFEKNLEYFENYLVFF